MRRGLELAGKTLASIICLVPACLLILQAAGVFRTVDILLPEGSWPLLHPPVSLPVAVAVQPSRHVKAPERSSSKPLAVPSPTVTRSAVPTPAAVASLASPFQIGLPEEHASVLPVVRSSRPPVQHSALARVPESVVPVPTHSVAPAVVAAPRAVATPSPAPAPQVTMSAPPLQAQALVPMPSTSAPAPVPTTALPSPSFSP